MIIQFWLGAILLLIIASAVFVIPFLATKKRDQNSDNNRNQLNRALYDVRINELEQDDNQGLLIDKDKIVSELQHNLLDDINDETIVATNNKNKWLWLPGLLLLTFGSVAMYWSVGAYQEVNDWENSLQRYPALQEKLFNNSESRPTEQELKDIMLGLRTQLANDPSDADGWLLYSRLGLVFKDSELALDAIKKAYQLKPSSVDIRLVFAQLKMQKGDEYSQQQAEFMLEQLLIDAPTELQAWSMYAFMALERQDFAAAIKRWKQMLTLVDTNTEQAGMLRDSIRYAEKQIQGQPVTAPIVEEKVATKTSQNIESEAAGVDAVGAPIYSVNISVADHVVVPDSGFIIVYAQAVSGPKMPIAAIKLALTTLPLSTQISDANAMMQGMKLSDHSEFVIKARLSKSGDVMNKEGDWQGVSNVIKAGQKSPVNIMITEQL
ncbi:c-type cytochrome biogenesis protein CcmI [Psychromonas sp. Urea-02u-13]|uniref:c-type cytochrome biogenesis protein CcmI n=1 Tax=Psychromonas sp. Urea-02u-13 TaxID=2058326 RepID=UPI000C337FEA|nr:c-type cytochrome biogenesis protein CcmI [Psychromonas sp. Urea-02u-13]PKG39883.1 c-type cytochrome biogenesis protein CcmI [Psychromonas sp. Urea-02u-13]